MESFYDSANGEALRHIGQTAQRQAVNALKGADFEGDGAQNWAQSQKPRVRQLAN